MARFDVYPRPDNAGYLLDVQADVLGELNTRIVIPLIPLGQAPLPAKRLNPVFEIAGQDCALITQFMAAVPRAILGEPVASLVARDAEISGALDMLLVGF